MDGWTDGWMDRWMSGWLDEIEDIPLNTKKRRNIGVLVESRQQKLET